MSKIRKAARADRKATHSVAKTRGTWPVRILGGLSEAADQPPLIALAAGTIATGAVLRRAGVVRMGARMLASHLFATGVKTVLKTSIDRTRPAKAMRDGHHIGEGTGTEESDLNSFPSGHTAGAVAIAQAVARDRPGAALPARMLAGAAAAIQMPRGKHYISDVLAGAAIGWASERVASAALQAGERGLRRAWASYAVPKMNSEPT